MSNYSPEALDLYGTSSSYKTRLEAIVLLDKALLSQPKESIINYHSLNIIHSLLKDTNVFVISGTIELITKYSIPVNLLYLKIAVKNNRLKALVFSYLETFDEKNDHLKSLNDEEALIKAFNDPNPNCKVFLIRIIRYLFKWKKGDVNDLIIKFCSDRNPDVRAEAKALLSGEKIVTEEVSHISSINKTKEIVKQPINNTINIQQTTKINEKTIKKIFAEPESPQTFKTHQIKTHIEMNKENCFSPVLPSHLKLSDSMLPMEWKQRLELLKTLSQEIPTSTYTINDIRYFVKEIDFAPFIFQFHTGNINILKYILSIQIHPNSIYLVMELCLSNQLRKELVEYFIKFSRSEFINLFKAMFVSVIQRGDIKGMKLKSLCSVLVEVKSKGYLLDWVIEGEFFGNDKREISTVNSLFESIKHIESVDTVGKYVAIKPSIDMNEEIKYNTNVNHTIKDTDQKRNEQNNMNITSTSIINDSVRNFPVILDSGHIISSNKEQDNIKHLITDTEDKPSSVRDSNDIKQIEDNINNLLNSGNPKLSEIKKEIEKLKLNNKIYENTNIIDYFLNTKTFVDLKDIFPVSKQIKYLSEVITKENESSIYEYLNEMFKYTFYRKLPENLKGYENICKKYENPLDCINKKLSESFVNKMEEGFNIKGEDSLENSLSNLSIRIEESRNNSTPISKKTRLLKIQPKYSLNLLLEKMQTPSNATNQFIYTLETGKLKIIANSLILYFSVEIERLLNSINTLQGEERLINLTYIDELIDFLNRILFDPPFLSKLKSSTIARLLLSLINDEKYFKKVVLEFKDNIECDLLIEVYSLCYVKSQSTLFIELLNSLEVNKYNSLRVSSVISKFVRVIENEKLLVCLSKIFKKCYGEGEVVDCKYLEKLIHY